MKLKKALNGGKVCWCLDGTISGKRKRLFFALDKQDKAEAALKAIQKDRKVVGNSWAHLPPKDRVKVVGVLQEMTDYNVTIEQVWNHYVLTTGRAANNVGISVAYHEFFAEKRQSGLAPSYIGSLESYVGRFAETFKKKSVGEITPSDVRKFLYLQPNLGTRQTWHSRITTFFSWCLKQEYCTSNPAEAVEKAKVVYDAPSILSVESCEKLLEVYRVSAPHHLANVVVKLFAGVRPEEAEKLTAENFDLDRGLLTVDAKVAKTSRRRVIELSPNCVAWLRYCGGYKYDPAANRDVRRRLTKKIGLEWSHDVLRHSAASYSFSKFGASKTAHWMGHSEQVLKTHYREIVTPQEAEAFWKIMPPVSG